MIKRRITVLAMVISFMFMCGCSGTEQPHSRKYARAVTISGSERITATFSFFDEEEKLCTAQGNTLEEVKAKAELELGKSLFTGHTEMIILGDGCDYDYTLEYLFNEWKVSPSCVVAYGGKESKKALESNGAEILTDSVKRAIKQKKAPECDIVTVLGDLLGEEKTAHIAGVDRSGFCGSVRIANK